MLDFTLQNWKSISYDSIFDHECFSNNKTSVTSFVDHSFLVKNQLSSIEYEWYCKETILFCLDLSHA
jgi:hypothetical protein